jgi:F420-dependent oxidoreductase-like protein
MKVGLMAPQGWKGEYDGWDPAAAWARTVELAVDAEALGFESLWAFDHFHTVPEPTDEMTLESFSVLTGLAMVTRRVRLGHMVVCTGFRNPALTAKLASTIDVISGGRFELGIGAGWKQDEWLAYGYGFPTIGERLAALRDHLEVIVRMLEPGRATYRGEYARVDGAINQPKGVQKPRIPIIVGGNGPNVTLRIAVRFADELNLVFVGPDRLREMLPLVRARCEEIGRVPDTLRISLYTRDEDVRHAGQARVDFLGTLQELGLSRAVCFPSRWTQDLETQARFAEDCRAAELEMTEPVNAGVAAGSRPT